MFDVLDLVSRRTVQFVSQHGPDSALLNDGGRLYFQALSNIQFSSPYPAAGGTVGTPASQPASTLPAAGRSSSSAVTFNRPNDTTTYGATDVIGSATTANHEITNVGLAGSLIQLQSATVIVDRTTLPAGFTTARLHLFTSAPAAIADNAAFAVASADRSKYAGFVDLPAFAVIGSGFLFSTTDYIGRPIRLTSSSLFANLALTGAAGFQPAAQTEYQIRFQAIEIGA